MKLQKKVILLAILCFMVIFTLVPIKALAATVGDQLLTPEDGWQRIQHSNSEFIYSGVWKSSTGVHWVPGGETSSISKNYITFKFYGSKIRFLHSRYPDHTNKLMYRIDGVDVDSADLKGEVLAPVIFSEVTDLELKEHTVKIYSGDGVRFDFFAIDIDSNGYMVNYNAPTNLKAIPDSSNISLTWDAVESASSYNIKRSTMPNGPYETIATGAAITYVDTNVTPGITYYYVVSAIVNGLEGLNSNEANALIKLNNVLKLVLQKYETKQLSVSEDLSDNTKLIWTSSDTTIATVDANGKVKAFKPGDTVITCTSEDGEYTDTIKVLVVDLDYQLAVDLLIGEKCRLTVDDSKDTAKVTWIVNDPTIATITSKGKVTAVGEGLTFITATDEDGKEIGKIFIRVRTTE